MLCCIINEGGSMRKLGVIFTFIIYLLAIPFYIYAYKNSMSLLFFIFILDRIMTFTVGAKMEKILDTMDLHGKDKKNASSFLMLILLLCLIGIVAIIYILFKYPKIFILLMVGEVIDNILRKIFKKLR